MKTRSVTNVAVPSIIPPEEVDWKGVAESLAKRKSGDIRFDDEPQLGSGSGKIGDVWFLFDLFGSGAARLSMEHLLDPEDDPWNDPLVQAISNNLMKDLPFCSFWDKDGYLLTFAWEPTPEREFFEYGLRQQDPDVKHLKHLKYD